MTPVQNLQLSWGLHAMLQLENLQHSAGGRLSGTYRVQVIVAERGPLVFVFNFSTSQDLDAYKVRPLLHACKSCND